MRVEVPFKCIICGEHRSLFHCVNKFSVYHADSQKRLCAEHAASSQEEKEDYEGQSEKSMSQQSKSWTLQGSMTTW